MSKLLRDRIKNILASRDADTGGTNIEIIADEILSSIDDETLVKLIRERLSNSIFEPVSFQKTQSILD